MYGVMNDNKQAVDVLLRHGADQSIANMSGSTAYDMAKPILRQETHLVQTNLRKIIIKGDSDAATLIKSLTYDISKINKCDDSVSH